MTQHTQTVAGEGNGGEIPTSSPKGGNTDSTTPNTQADRQPFPDKSQFEIERWAERLNSDYPKAIEALRGYICSLTLGRGFNEDFDAYIIRKGLVRFIDFARHELNSWADIELTKSRRLRT